MVRALADPNSQIATNLAEVMMQVVKEYGVGDTVDSAPAQAWLYEALAATDFNGSDRLGPADKERAMQVLVGLGQSLGSRPAQRRFKQAVVDLSKIWRGEQEPEALVAYTMG